MGEHSRGAVQQLKKTCPPMIDLNEALKAERSIRRGLCGWRSWVIYSGARSFIALNTIRRIWYLILKPIGSQCNFFRTGVIWDLFLVRVTKIDPKQPTTSHTFHQPFTVMQIPCCTRNVNANGTILFPCVHLHWISHCFNKHSRM